MRAKHVNSALFCSFIFDPLPRRMCRTHTQTQIQPQLKRVPGGICVKARSNELFSKNEMPFACERMAQKKAIQLFSIGERNVCSDLCALRPIIFRPKCE